MSDEYFNVGSGVQTSIRQVCEMLLEETGSDLPIQFEPAGPTFVTNRVGSTEKAERLLGFRTTVPLREGLRRVIEWRERDKMAAV